MRWVILAAVCIAVVAAAAGGGALYWKHRFHPSPPEFDFPRALTLVDARVQDIEALAEFGRLNRSYTEEQRRAFETGRRKLAARVRTISNGEFELEIMRLLALADNGHTNLLPWPWLPTRKFQLFPVRFYRFEDGIYVVRAINRIENLLGARLTAIDGTEIDAVDEKLRSYIGGEDSFYRLMMPIILERPFLLNAAGITTALNTAEMTFVLPSGEERRVILSSFAGEHEKYRRFPSVYLSTGPFEGEPGYWVRLKTESGKLPAFREPGKVQRYLEDRASGVAYIQMRFNGGPGLKGFTDDTVHALKTLRPRTLIVDARFNSGGDYRKSYRLMRRLPDFLGKDGQIYILVGAETFSAGIHSVAFLRDAAGERSTIIGGPMGDSEQFWSEGGFLVLPNSGLSLWYNTARHDVENGCYDPGNCYWLNFIYPVAAGSLDPEVSAPIRFTDYVKGRDLALETALHRAGLEPDQVRLSAPRE